VLKSCIKASIYPPVLLPSFSILLFAICAYLQLLASTMRFFLFLSILAPAIGSTILPNTVARDPSVAQAEALEKNSRLKDRDAGTTYMAWATDPKNDNEIQETRKFLNETVVNKDEFISTVETPDRGMFIWGSLTLDDAALKKVKAYSKLKDVMVEEDVEDDRAISPGEEEAKPA
jgi:hypothetical protein